MANLERPDWDEPRTEAEGFHALRARLGHQLGTEHLGLSLWEVHPGQAAYPYHLHLAEEEALVVLAGRPSLRTPEGWRDLEPGDVVAFPLGAEGAHQVVNTTDQPVRFLAISTHGQPDIVLYPDSGKVGAAERLPDGGGFRAFFRLADQVDYWDGEEPPRR
jgi:uncharacterized cupin superfamily protein